MKKIVVLLVGFLLALAPMTAAQAHSEFATQGKDYSYNYDHNSGMVYDDECDGHKVYTEIQKVNDRVKKWDDGGCNGGTKWGITGEIKWMRTCENIIGGPDWCGSWVYH